MRRSERGFRWTFAAAALCGLYALPVAAEEPGLRKLRVETHPAGAEVVLVGGAAGFTPLSVGERAIYPNDYPDGAAHLYGTVTLRRAGCKTVVHRVTLDDLAHGLSVALDCTTASTMPAAPAGGHESVSGGAAPSASLPAATEAVSRRRLRQLQVLQELLDEGLIDTGEEQRIRRRVLEAP